MNMSQQTTETGASIAGKVASVPPLTAGAASIAGVALPDPVQVLTAIWLIVLIAHMIWKWRKEAEQYKKGAPVDGSED